jgi:hypothetical protein
MNQGCHVYITLRPASEQSRPRPPHLLVRPKGGCYIFIGKQRVTGTDNAARASAINGQAS